MEVTSVFFSKNTLSGTLLLPHHFNFLYEEPRKFEFFSKNVPKFAIFSLLLAFLDNPLTLLLPPHFKNFLQKFYPHLLLHAPYY